MIKKDSLFNGLFLTSMVLVLLCIYSIVYEKSAFLQDNFKQVNILPIKKRTLHVILKPKNIQGYNKIYILLKTSLLVKKNFKLILTALKLSKITMVPIQHLSISFNHF